MTTRTRNTAKPMPELRPEQLEPECPECGAANNKFKNVRIIDSHSYRLEMRCLECKAEWSITNGP